MNIRKLIKEEIKNVLSEARRAKEGTVNAAISDFYEKMFRRVMDEVDRGVKRRADIEVDKYKAQTVDGFLFVKLYGYNRSDMNTEVQVTIRSYQDATEVMLEMKNPMMRRKGNKREFEFSHSELPDEAINTIARYIENAFSQ